MRSGYYMLLIILSYKLNEFGHRKGLAEMIPLDILDIILKKCIKLTLILDSLRNYLKLHCGSHISSGDNVYAGKKSHGDNADGIIDVKCHTE